mmetsp:Transcript_2756/g.8865  ORF Transcript_2756/g.8865 Transcript_2756/m.8865 type:complete len:243 (+) Transcript_2756:4221-4949(+)
MTDEMLAHCGSFSTSSLANAVTLSSRCTSSSESSKYSSTRRFMARHTRIRMIIRFCSGTESGTSKRSTSLRKTHSDVANVPCVYMNAFIKTTSCAVVDVRYSTSLFSVAASMNFSMPLAARTDAADGSVARTMVEGDSSSFQMFTRCPASASSSIFLSAFMRDSSSPGKMFWLRSATHCTSGVPPAFVSTSCLSSTSSSNWSISSKIICFTVCEKNTSVSMLATGGVVKSLVRRIDRGCMRK